MTIFTVVLMTIHHTKQNLPFNVSGTLIFICAVKRPPFSDVVIQYLTLFLLPSYVLDLTCF